MESLIGLNKGRRVYDYRRPEGPPENRRENIDHRIETFRQQLAARVTISIGFEMYGNTFTLFSFLFILFNAQ